MTALATRYPPATRGTVVVWGLLANHPFGGMTWQALHYVVGLRRLGFDVWYVEENELPLIRPGDLGCPDEGDDDANVRWLARWMDAVGLGDRWIFRSPGATATAGRTDVSLEQLYAACDAGFDLCGSHGINPRQAEVPVRVLVETDPVPMQVGAAKGDEWVLGLLSRYTDLFTYGRNLGAADSPIPMNGRVWHRTWPPVLVDWWDAGGPPDRDAALTTVLNWGASGKDVEWDGVPYVWRKDVAFAPFEPLPQRSALPLELAVIGMNEETQERLRGHGWRVKPVRPLNEPLAYRDYIRRSAGEFTPAKDQYVRSRSGWFSDRSVCYLAAGRPVITEDTGFGRFAPTGEGLLSFTDTDGAAAAIEAVASDPARHGAAAREIAREHFGADRLLEDMVRRLGLS